MSLALGSAGPEVRQLQEWLNKLPSKNQTQLTVDGQYGPNTHARVQEFQSNNRLVANGIAGPLTIEAIQKVLRLLGLLPPIPSPVNNAVRVITQKVLGSFPSNNNLIQQVIPAVGIIDIASFRPGDKKSELRFRYAPLTTSRLVVFAAKKDDLERAAILLLPGKEKPDRVLICITQRFAQASPTLEPLGWSNPLSPELIKFCLLKHVIKRYGPQTLASKKRMTLVYIVRAKGKELGPFAEDGAFVRQCLTEMTLLTSNAFSFDRVEAFTYSSGILDFNPFLSSVNGHLSVEAVYNIDPRHAIAAQRPEGAVRKQYLSGQTGGPSPGFEFLPLNRWKNEDRFPSHKAIGSFHYLHNHAMPNYVLYLAIQTS